MKIYASTYGATTTKEDNTIPIQAAINKAKDGDTVILPSGKLSITDTLLIKNKGIKLVSAEETFLYQYVPKPAIVFDRDQPTRRALMENITLHNSYGKEDANGINGIEIAVPITIRDCRVENFFGNGIVVSADVVTRPGTDASFSKFDSVLVSGCKLNGILFQGGDANACYVHADVRDNGECGIRDASMLGNQFWGCMAHNNGRNYSNEPFDLTQGSNSRSGFFGCYSEGGSLKERLYGSAIWLGGMPTNGIELYGNAMFVYGNQVLYQKGGVLMSLVKDIFNIYPSI